MKTGENSMEEIEAVYFFTVFDVQQLLNAFHRTYGQTTPTHWGHLYTKHLTRQILTSLTGIIHTPRASSWAQENPTYRRLMPQVDIGTSPCKICLRVKVIRISQKRNIVGFFLIRKIAINISILFFCRGMQFHSASSNVRSDQYVKLWCSSSDLHQIHRECRLQANFQ